MHLQCIRLEHIHGLLCLLRRCQGAYIADNQSLAQLLTHNLIAALVAILTHSAILRAYGHAYAHARGHLRQLAVDVCHHLRATRNCINEKRQTKSFA